MSVYSISSIDVKDWDAYREYMRLVPSIIEKFGGKYLVRGGEMESLEGKMFHGRMVIIEFPNKELAMKFYKSEEYKPLLDLRTNSGISNLVIVDGH